MVLLHLLPSPSSALLLRGMPPGRTPSKRRGAGKGLPGARPAPAQGGDLVAARNRRKARDSQGRPPGPTARSGAAPTARDLGVHLDAQSDLLCPRSCVPGPPPATGSETLSTWRWDLRLPPLPARPACSSPQGNACTPPAPPPPAPPPAPPSPSSSLPLSLPPLHLSLSFFSLLLLLPFLSFSFSLVL